MKLRPKTAKWCEFFMSVTIFAVGAYILVADTPTVRFVSQISLGLLLLFAALIIARSALSND